MAVTEFVVDANQLTRSPSGLISGGIWLRVDGRAFPAEGWADSVVVVLAWWADAALDLIRGITGAREIHFMEGPYLVRVQAASAGEWRLDLIERGIHEVARGTVMVDARALARDIVESSAQTLAACREHSWSSPDAIRLQAEVTRLGHLVARQPYQ
jgi:hypothetical protein